MELQRTLEGHDGCVNAVAFDPTGTLLVSGSDDQRIMVWDWEAGEQAERGLRPAGQDDCPSCMVGHAAAKHADVQLAPVFLEQLKPWATAVRGPAALRLAPLLLVA